MTDKIDYTSDDDFYENYVWETNMHNTDRFMKPHARGKPKATDLYTVDQLVQQGMVGVYIKKDE